MVLLREQAREHGEQYFNLHNAGRVDHLASARCVDVDQSSTSYLQVRKILRPLKPLSTPGIQDGG